MKFFAGALMDLMACYGIVIVLTQILNLGLAGCFLSIIVYFSLMSMSER